MADRIRYPQIPSTVWWGVRAIFQKTPNVTVDERLLGIQLGVQEAAARAYVSELRNVGILTEDGKATPIAHKWRLDDSYPEAVQQLVEGAYPQGLMDLAPPGEAERQKVVSWFQREGFGSGAAGNKAATYLLVSSPVPDESPRAGSKMPQEVGVPLVRSARRQQKGKTDSGANVTVNDVVKKNGGNSTGDAGKKSENFPLNVNVQIHISADAGTEQIESIFQAMRRYLYDSPNS